MNIFQRGLILKKNFQSVESNLYLRSNITLDLESEFIKLKKDDYVSTDTYFNLLSVKKIKKYTVIDNVFLNLIIKGNLKITIFHVGEDYIENIIYSNYFNLKNKEDLTIEIKDWINIQEGIIYFVVEAIDEVIFFDFSYSTKSIQSQEVNLCLVITHFNRQNFLISALDRINADLFVKKSNKKIDLLVSDNSQNLNYKENNRIKIFKNKNYGGSGGFSFGLLKAKELNYTHCLFMDDDASTEIESILRAYDLLSYAINSNLAIVGAMLYEDRQNIQHENGAILKNAVESIGRGIDLSIVKNLIINENIEKIDYAGWWFFAFPILENIKYPYPFFVRGDDVSFGVANNFEMMTINGICSWQEDFSYKHSDFLHYLNIRSLYVMSLISQAKGGVFLFYMILIKSFLTGIFTYRYNLSISALEALSDVLYGENFWKNNLDMRNKKNKLQEKFFEYDCLSVDSINFIKSNYEENFLRKIFRIFTFNGLLIPSIFFRNSVLIPFYKIRPKDVFLKKYAFFRENDEKLYGFKYDKNLIIRLYIKFFILLVKSSFMLPYLYFVYPKIYKNLTSENFWTNVFREGE